ncbi:ATP-binding protein [Pelomonas sp. SE-A7]|uniref:ATP-binding protein n=1 Tax=Pelomonas sp. SE-A7 TaxID=3054953 RepID=UPI00259CF64F|nr:ATP-binding protein [Pelomonas sp. SE-A7]MDM4768438.1 ATP-binding protein [Pelomonas sp. SE-A7]
MSHDMDESLNPLEQRLLLEPFNAALRRDYAQALLRNGRSDDAARQARLLLQQQPDDAAARALLEEAEAPPPAPQAVASGNGRLQLVGAAPAPKVQSLVTAAPADKVRFTSIVGMEALKKTLRLKIIEPYLKPGLFDRFRMNSGGGLLLYGPPGCGKTLLARALANECKAEFISAGVSDVLSMWQGESERNLAALFEKARSQQPCVLFFDELDALAYARSKAGAASARTVVNEFLAQLDGFGRENKGVLMLAATNMPWDVDDAMKRPGRFSRQIFVPPPDADARRGMFEAKLLGVPSQGLDFAALAARSEHCSGADIDGLIELAKESALADALDGDEDRGLAMSDFDAALAQLQPSTLDWLRTVRNVVKYAGDDGTYREVETYLKKTRLL